MNEEAGALAAPSVGRFIEKIARERDAAVARIRAEAREAGTALRRNTRHESRRLLHASAVQVRAQTHLERQRLLSGLLAQLRRRQWQELQDWVQQGVEEVMVALCARWSDRGRQWEWAQFWLRAAAERAGAQALHVEIGAPVDEVTLHRVEKFLRDHAAGGELHHVPGIGCGLKIAWGPYLLDGTFPAQRGAVETALLARLARQCHECDRKP